MKLKLKFQSKLKLRCGNHAVQKPKYLIWPSKLNLTYAPETMSSTDRRTDRWTDGQGESSIPPPPPTSLGEGIMKSVWLFDTCMGSGLHVNQVLLCWIYVRPDDVIKWKHFPRYWSFVWGIHQWPVNSPHKGQWHRALIFSLICTWINGWVNNCEAGDWDTIMPIMTST